MRDYETTGPQDSRTIEWPGREVEFHVVDAKRKPDISLLFFPAPLHARVKVRVSKSGAGAQQNVSMSGWRVL